MCAADQTVALGLCGVLTMWARVRGVIAALISAKSGAKVRGEGERDGELSSAAPTGIERRSGERASAVDSNLIDFELDPDSPAAAPPGSR